MGDGPTRPAPADPRHGDPRGRLIDYVFAERVTLAARCVEGMRSAIPVYQSLDPDDLARASIRNIELLFTSVAQDRPLEPQELTEIAAHGRRRAEMGVSIDDLLRSWRLSIGTFTESIRQFAREHAIAEPVLLQLVIDAHTHSDSAMVAAASGHREAELEMVGNERHRRADLVRGVLYGTLSPADLRVRARAYGVEVTAIYHALRARPRAGQTTAKLERHLELSGIPHHGLITVIDGDLVGFVDRAPGPDLPGFVGIGPASRLDRLEESFRSATRALDTAAAFGMEGVHDLESLGVRPAVVADQEVGDILVRRYVEPLSTLPHDMGDTLARTVERYLSNGRRIDPTAEELVVHPNTLRYRIRRFEDIARCDLREPEAALEVWWALQRARLNPDPPA
ncbi:PucR family transcriptional regulator [Streptomyces sp. NPDC057438]|uniref:PucR family transcriptional regulator n=1 Tax=Streptomyces sp. NPDC057438 TaxID=3346133 RepID=UPI0036BB4B75